MPFSRSTQFVVAVCTLAAGPCPAEAAVGDIEERLAVARHLPVASNAVDVAVDGPMQRVYALVDNDGDAGEVWVFDTTSNAHVATIPVGSWPSAIAANPVTDRMYVTSVIDDNASVLIIEGATNEVVESIDLGPWVMATDLAIDPLTNRIYVLTYDAFACPPAPPDGKKHHVRPPTPGRGPRTCRFGTIRVIDGATEEIVDTIAEYGSHLALDPERHRLYVARQFGLLPPPEGNPDEWPGDVIAINTIGNAVLGVPAPVGVDPGGLDMDAVTGKVYVANGYDMTVTVIEEPSHRVSATIPTALGPVDVAVDPLRRRAYVTSDEGVQAIDIETDRLVTGVGLNRWPTAVAADGTTGRIYALESSDYSCPGCPSSVAAVMRTGWLSLSSGWPAPSPYGVAINAVTRRMYVVDNNSNAVSVVDADSLRVLKTIGVGWRPIAVVVNPVTNRIYVTNEFWGAVAVIDGETDTLVTVVMVGEDPNTNPIPIGITVSPPRNRVYVANVYEQSVSVIDGDTDTMVKTIAIGDHAYDVAYDPATDRLFVPGSETSIVAVIDGSTEEVIGTVALPPGTTPLTVAVHPDAGRLYVGNGTPTLTILETASVAVLASVDLDAGTKTVDLAVDTSSGMVYAAQVHGLAIVDPRALLQIAYVQGGALGVAVDPQTSVVYVGDGWDGVTFFPPY